MQEPVHPLRKVRNLGDIVSSTIESVRLYAKPLFFAITKHAGPFAVTGSVVVAISQTFSLSASLSDVLLQRELLEDSAPAFLVLQFVGVGFVVYTSIIVVNVVVSFLQFVDNNAREPDAAELSLAMHGRTSKLVVTTIYLVFLAVAAAGLFVVATLSISEVTGAVFLALPVVGFALLYFALPLLILFPVILFEDLALFDAAKRCRELVTGRWWWTLGTALVLGIITSTINAIGSVPFYLVSGISIFVTNSSDTSEPNIILQILSILFGSISGLVGIYVSTITTTGVIYIYWSHRERLEGVSLLDRIESIDIGHVHDSDSNA